MVKRYFNGLYDMVLKFYSDSDYKDQITTYPLQTILNDQIYVRTDILHDAGTFDAILDRCVATTSEVAQVFRGKSIENLK